MCASPLCQRVLHKCGQLQTSREETVKLFPINRTMTVLVMRLLGLDVM